MNWTKIVPGVTIGGHVCIPFDQPFRIRKSLSSAITGLRTVVSDLSRHVSGLSERVGRIETQMDRSQTLKGMMGLMASTMQSSFQGLTVPEALTTSPSYPPPRAHQPGYIIPFDNYP